MILPGYVAVVLGIILFSPSLLNISTDNGSSLPNNLSFEIFSALVLIVAGPAIGFTLSEAITVALTFVYQEEKHKFLRAYSRLKFKCTDVERAEMDNVDSRISFTRSTGIVLIIIGLLLLSQPVWIPHTPGIKPLINTQINNTSSTPANTNTQIPTPPANVMPSIIFIIVGAALVYGAYLEFRRVHVHLVCKLLKDYDIIEEYPDICKKDYPL
jgi:hypothetical protein